MKARRKSDGEIIEVKEWRGASDVVYSEPDMNHFYRASDFDFNVDAEETVISGWVARDSNPHRLYIYYRKPIRLSDMWTALDESFKIDSNLFPDLTWESEPIKVSILIKRE